MFLGFTAQTIAQNCATRPTQWLLDQDVNHPATYNRNASLPKANKVFSVYVYICLDTEEQPVASPSDVQPAIDRLNTAFAPIGFSFNVCQYVTVPDYYYRELSPSGRMDELFVLHYHPEVINLYITESASGDTPLDGFSYMPGPGEPDAVVVNADALDANSPLLMHHLGHFFGLYHTNENTTGIELANGSNCQTAGDLICDTEADPGTDTDQCVHYTPVADAQGTRYIRPVDNYMSLYPCACRFTTEQYQRMYSIYGSSRSYLK